MKYVELNIIIPENTAEGSEILAALLSESGYYGFLETEKGLKAYIEEDKYDNRPEETCKLIDRDIYGDIEISHSILESKNWNDAWEKNFKPVIIEDFVHIRAPFHDKDDSVAHEVIIQPRMAFGTGHHETTFLMLQTMRKTDFSGKKVLDAGCGTGILSFLSEKMGAVSITAIDTDEDSYINTIDNSELNGSERIIPIKGNIRSLDKNETYDIILANITKNVLLEEMKNYSGRLNNNGILLISGFYEEDLEEIRNEAKKHKLEFVSCKSLHNWMAAEFSCK